MAHLLISAAHKSSGKTTVSLGLCAALTMRGQMVQPFKKGPDYIDPHWLGMAANRPCYNLDFYTMQPDEISSVFAHRTRGSDVAIIEGNKGLYDGLDLDGSNSNAALARLLHAPVILVLDARGMTRGIAPLILGYQSFEPDIRIAGVILNRLGGERHEEKLRAVIEHYTDAEVVGAVYNNPELEIVERHLGLIPSNEASQARGKISAIAEIMEAQLDVDRIVELAHTAPMPDVMEPSKSVARRTPDVRIAFARDSAFGFYYPDDLEALRAAGADLVAFDTTVDQTLPEVDGLFIGGGFPESRMAQLEKNVALRTEIRRRVAGGLPVYAECGGLMYLARSLIRGDERREMAGVLPLDVVMCEKPQGRGYVHLQETPGFPWPDERASASGGIHAHEFHYSRIDNPSSELKFAYRVLRGQGVDGQHDGIVYRNVLASYVHLRNTRDSPWAARFVEFVRRCRKQTTDEGRTH